MIKSFLSDKKGIMSILSIILILIIAIVATGFLNIMSKSMAITEVQGIMDTSGIMALRHGVDKDLFRQEIIEVDPVAVTSHFRSTVRSSISKIGAVEDYEIRFIKVHEPNSAGLKSLGIPDGERGQYYLESIVVVWVDRSSEFGPSNDAIWNFYNFFVGPRDSDQQVTVKRVDGKDAIILRSVTRMVLR